MTTRARQLFASPMLSAMLLALAPTASGQGLVNFANTFQTNTYITTNSVEQGSPTGWISGPRDSYYFALFVSPPNSVSNAPPGLVGWTYTGAIGTNTGAVGRFSGNPTPPGAPIVGYDPGEVADFLVFGWSGNIGTTWQQAQAWWNNGDPDHGSLSADEGWFGYSTIARRILLSNSTPVGNIFGLGSDQALGFNLEYYAVPEPASGWKMGLGAIVLLVYRRRSRRHPTC